jgi:hypothetical protein
MVNDFLKELYINIAVPHMVWLLAEPLTIDNKRLSEAKRRTNTEIILYNSNS